MSNEENLNEKEAENAALSADETAEKAETQAAETSEAPAETPSEQTEQNETTVETDDAQASEKTADAEQDKKTEKNNKSVKPPKKSGAGMSKTFKLVYYPVLALFAVLMFVFSVIDGVFGYSPKAYDGDYYTAVNAHIAEISRHPRSAMSSSFEQEPIGLAAAQSYITDKLAEGGFKLVEEQKTDEEDSEPQKTVTEWANTAGATEPTVTYHTATPSTELQNKMGVTSYIAGHELTNIVAAIPSKEADAGAVIITVRYDTRTDTTGAADNAAFVATAMQSLIEFVKSGTSFKNDIVVVFTEDLDNAFGAYAFFDSFEGLGNVAARAKYGINLDAYGNSGTLALTDVSGAGLDYINAVTAVSGNAFNSSIVESAIPETVKYVGAVAAFGDVPAVQIAVLGGMDAAQSSSDTAANISQAVIRQQSDFFKSYVQKFGDVTAEFGSASDNNVFFSYFDAGTVAYNDVAAYVIGALILVLLGVCVAMTIVKKTFSFKNLMLAAGAELLVILSSLVAGVAAYFLVTLMLTGFGVLPIHAITAVTYFNAGIFIAALLVSLASAFGFTVLYKKLFKVTASDVVRGTAVLFGLCGAIMSFACPAYSFITSWLGLLMLAVLLVTVCTHKMFKDKFGFGMDRLYIYAIPVAICLPFVVSQLSALMWLLPLAMLPVIMTVFTGLLGVAVPYLERTQPMLDKLAKKLPMRTQRVERTVVEKVEDKAKKGKFTERTVRKIEKEKVPVNYKNYFGISVVAVLAIVVALFSGGFGVTSEKTLTGFRPYDNAVYNDAVVYEWSKDSSGTSIKRLVIDDLMLYKYARYAIDGLEWDGVKYSKSISTDIHVEPNITRNENLYTVTTYEGAQSTVTVTIPSARNITKITVKETSKEAIDDYEGFVYEFRNQSTITLRLPYGFANFTMEFEGGNPTNIEYEERIVVDVNEQGTAMDAIDDWNKLKSYYNDTAVYNNLRGAMVIKRAFASL